MSAPVDTFTFPGHLDDGAIDQIIDMAARSYLAVDVEHGAIVIEPDHGAVIALRMIGTMFDMGDTGRVVIVCEPEHTLFWEEQVENCTDLKSLTYSGSNRQDKLRKECPDVIISTCEVLRNDLLIKEQIKGKRSTGTWQRGPHFSSLTSPNTLWVFAHNKALLNRTTETHRAWARALDFMDDPRTLALQQGVSNGEALYNLGRLMLPERMPTVAEFDRVYGHGRSRSASASVIGVAKLFGHTLVRAQCEDF